MNKHEQKKQLDKRFKSIDYSQIPYTNAIPNKKTLETIDEPMYRLNE